MAGVGCSAKTKENNGEKLHTFMPLPLTPFSREGIDALMKSGGKGSKYLVSSVGTGNGNGASFWSIWHFCGMQCQIANQTPVEEICSEIK